MNWILGSMYFGTAVPEDEAFAILDRYWRMGGRIIDTANCYAAWMTDSDDHMAGTTGYESETVIGKWVRERKLHNHPELHIITKVGDKGQRDVWDRSLDMFEMVMGSAARLGTMPKEVLLHGDSAMALPGKLDRYQEVMAEGEDASLERVEYPRIGLCNVSSKHVADVNQASSIMYHHGVRVPSKAQLEYAVDMPHEWMGPTVKIPRYIYGAFGLLSSFFSMPPEEVLYNDPIRAQYKRIWAWVQEHMGQTDKDWTATDRWRFISYLVCIYNYVGLTPVIGVSNIAQLREYDILNVHDAIPENVLLEALGPRR